MYKKSRYYSIRFFIFYTFITFLLVFLALESVITIKGPTYVPTKSDAIVILGHSLDDNLNPSTWLSDRLVAGAELYFEGYGTYVVTTGGINGDDPISCAEVMADFLVNLGVPRENIIIESRSTNTDENIRFAKELLSPIGVKSIVVVSSDFHMFRSLQTADLCFSEVSGQGVSHKTSTGLVLAYIREAFSYMKHVLLRPFWAGKGDGV